MKYYLLTWVVITDRQTEFADRLPQKMQDIARNLFYCFANATLPLHVNKAEKILKKADKYTFVNDDSAMCYFFETDDDTLLEKLEKDPYVLISRISKEQYDKGEAVLHFSMSVSAQGAKPENP